MHARWPELNPADTTLLASKDYVDRLLRESRFAMQPPKKKKGPVVPFVPPTAAKIFVASEFPDWQNSVIAVMQEMAEKGEPMDMRSLTQLFAKDDRTKVHMKNKKLITFARDILVNLELFR